MKRITALFLGAMLLLALSACGAPEESPTAAETETKAVTAEGSKTTQETPIPEASLSFVSGEWRALIPARESIRALFGDKLDAYLDYDELLQEGVTLTLSADGSYTLSSDGDEALLSYDELIEEIMEGVDGYLEEKNLSYAEWSELSRAEFTERVREEIAISSGGEESHSGTWTLDGATLTLSSSDQTRTLTVTPESESRMILLEEDTPRYVCERGA